jgi:hypothetical protein
VWFFKSTKIAYQNNLRIYINSNHNYSLASPVRGEDKGLGMIDIFSTIIKEEGVSGLYRGLLPNFLKVIPAVSIGYVVYEQFKKILKVTSVK